MEPSAANALVPVLWIILFLAALIAAGFGAVLAYHWIRFSSSHGITAFTLTTYTIGALLFLTVMLASISALSL